MLPAALWHALVAPPASSLAAAAPRLLLCSARDTVIDVSSVRLCAAEMQAAGLQVEVHEWADSGHVRMFKVWPPLAFSQWSTCAAQMAIAAFFNLRMQWIDGKLLCIM